MYIRGPNRAPMYSNFREDDDCSVLTDDDCSAASQVERWLVNAIQNAPDKYARFRGKTAADLDAEIMAAVSSVLPGREEEEEEAGALCAGLAGRYYWARDLADVPMGRFVRWMSRDRCRRQHKEPRLTAGGVVTGFAASPDGDHQSVSWRSCGGGRRCRFGQFRFDDHLVFVKMTESEQLVTLVSAMKQPH